MKSVRQKLLFRNEYFIFLLPLFFVIHGCQQNFPLVPFWDALVVTIAYELSALVILVLSFSVFKSWHKAVMFSFFLMCIQFFFGLIHDVLMKSRWFTSFSKYSFLLATLFFSIVVVFIYLKRTKNEFRRTTVYLNTCFFLLILIDLAILSYKALNHKPEGLPKYYTQCSDCAKPNIYFILADEYAGRKELKDLFSYDNTHFEEELRKRQFFVASSPKSNYNFTPYSMASLFNMNYIKGITNKSNDLHNQNICFQTINHNELTRTLKKIGYDFVNISPFDFADKPNVNNYNNFYSSRATLITSQTLTGRLKKDLAFHLAYTLKIKWAFDNYLDNLVNILNYQEGATIKEAKTKGNPRFVYTHLIMPHYPYLYDENQKRVPIQRALLGGKKEYLGFLQYGNKKLLALVDSIQSNDRSDPIIILMSDHGFTKYDLSQAAPSYNFQNIFTIHLPGNNYVDFSDSISNVNIFRTLLNSQFKQKLPLLKDSSFFLIEY